MVHFITLYSFLTRKRTDIYYSFIVINNWKQGIYQDEYNGVVGYYKNDKLHGPWYYWHSNGQLSIKCYYKNGKLHGQLCEKCYHKNDKLHDKYYRWDEQGNLIENSIY